MPKDPSYVRLQEQHSFGIVADIVDYGTLWSISGNDVKPFPDEEDYPNEAAYVRELLRRGVLEPASKAEWQELQDAAAKLKEIHFGQDTEREKSNAAMLQEHNVQDVVNKTQRRIAKRRAQSAGDEEDSSSDAESESSDQEPGSEEHSAGKEPAKSGKK